VHSAEFAGAVATHWVTPPPETTHHADRSLHLLAAVGLAAPGAAHTLSLHLGDSERRAADVLIEESGLPPEAPVAVLAPGASCSARRYPPGRFAAAAAMIASAGLPVRVTGPAAEAELVAAVVDGAAHPGVRALPPTSVPGFAALLGRASVAITNNSGGMHIADAVGTPVAVAHAGTDRYETVRPRSVPAEMLDRPVPCSPCRLLVCPYHQGCLDVAPRRLAEAALRLAAPRTDPLSRYRHHDQETPCPSH
jgi:ADP-heptose:LPS heptosyltransferase